MRRLIKRFMADQSGATAVEYALIVTFLSIVVATAITSLGRQLFTLLLTTTQAIH